MTISQYNTVRIDAVKVFRGLSKDVFIDLNAKDPIAEVALGQLMNLQNEKNLPFVMAVVQMQDNYGNPYYKNVSAHTFCQWMQKNTLTDVTNIFYFVLHNNANKPNDCFHYLGNQNEVGNPKLFLETYLCACDGHVASQDLLSSCYFYGFGVPKDEEEAVRWLKIAADSGNTDSEYKLGCYYFFSKGTFRNEQEAVKYWKSAAAKEHVEAMFHLATYYEFNHGCYSWNLQDKTNCFEAHQLYTTAAKKGHFPSKTFLQLFYDRKINMDHYSEGAIKMIKYFADLGFSGAKLFLAQCYENGNGMKKNMTNSFALYWEAAAMGNVKAQFQVGFFYMYGKGIKIDEEKAFSYWAMAASNGYPPAMFKVGLCLLIGVGTWPSDSAAFLYFKTAAKLGQMNAQYTLAYCYFTGIGTVKNPEKCHYWLNKAKKQGHPHAIKLLAEEDSEISQVDVFNQLNDGSTDSF